MDPRYFRFVLDVPDDQSRHAAGLFQVRLRVRRRDLAPHEYARIGRAFEWFGTYLPVPPVVKRDDLALSWFRHDAGEPLRRARLLVAWLRSRGYPVETLQTRDPGEVLYRDAWQVAARPRERTYTGLGTHRPRDWVAVQRLTAPARRGASGTGSRGPR